MSNYAFMLWKGIKVCLEADILPFALTFLTYFYPPSHFITGADPKSVDPDKIYIKPKDERRRYETPTPVPDYITTYTRIKKHEERFIINKETFCGLFR